MNCPSCQHENRPAARFCAGCGAKLQRDCPQCGAEVEPAARFCDECGASLQAATPPPAAARPPSLEEGFATMQQAMPASFREQVLTPAEGENRVVTVLFADMSRSVEATGELHPEDAVALVNRLLKAMVDVLLKYEGRVDRFLGDGLLAVFGVPQAHESDPERAVLAAMEIREAAHQLGLQVTAGINTGEVYAGGVGSEQHQEVTAMGPAVNLAARLQGHAEPDQILIGEATHRHTRRAFEFSPLTLQIKGIAQPVTAFAVERALPRPEKARGIEGLRSELIGRDEEFGKLKEALDELRRGRGQMVTLIGEAGVGKSRLVVELKSGVQAFRRSGVQGDRSERLNARTPERLIWLEGRCLELGMTASYWLFVDLFRDYFAWQPDEDDRARGERLVACLREFVARGDLTEERCEEIGPLLGNLLSLRFGTDWDERLKNAGPEQIKYQTFLAVRDFFVTLARRQPVLLVFEDLHWADSLSLDLISLLMETLTRDPLFLLCAHRPEQEHKCWRLGSIASQKCADRYTELHLRELTSEQSRRLIGSLLTIENLPAAVKELILEKSRGNPFFVEEVVRSLIASGMVYQEANTWRAREGIEGVTVPESIQSVIMSRVDRLERESKQVLESASVIGRLFRRRLLGRMTRLEQALERALEELEDRQLIYQERAVPEEEFSFKHVLTLETVYGSILRRRRTVFHQQVAEAMEALYAEGLDEYYEQLAYHYERSQADEKAIEYLLKAGEKAHQAYLAEAAISYFERALDRLNKVPAGETSSQWRLAALKGLGESYWGMGKIPESEAPFREAIALGQEMGLPARDVVRLYYWLGRTIWWLSRYDEGIRLHEEGLAMLGDDTKSLEAALMMEQLAMLYLYKGDVVRHRELAYRVAGFIESLPYSEELRPAFVRVFNTYTWMDRNVEEGLRWLSILEQKAGQYRDLRGLGVVPHNRAILMEAQGDLRGSIPHFQRSLELFTNIGDLARGSWCLHHLESVYESLGDLRAAEECAGRSREMTEAMGNKRDLANWFLRAGITSLCQSLWAQAAEAFRTSAHLYQEIGWSGVWAALALGRTHLAQGQREEAWREFADAVTRLKVDAPDEFAHSFPRALSGLEEASATPQQFQQFCDRFRSEHPAVAGLPFSQWLLEVTAPHIGSHRPVRDTFASALAPDWTWHDQYSDCASSVQADGLEIHAANGRELEYLNLSAPRVTRTLAGPFAIQAICLRASSEKPATGGLLLWKDQQNYLRLERGTRGKHEISFQGCLAKREVIIGRGRLPAERIFLRLERLGSRVNALCSADGQNWLTVGHAEFPSEDPVQVGLHAIGAIDRTIYPGAYPDGTAIRFESFEVWT